jgi:hypothetical protein
MRQFRLSLIIAVIFTAMQAVEPRASAVTISFIEARNEGATTTTVNLAGCPGCILVTAIGGVETGTASFTAPGGFFGDRLPMGATLAQAILVEPPGIPGEPAGAISDRVLLEINNTPDIISVLANFLSDPESVVTFPPAGFPTVVETGRLQTISGNFATEPTPGVFMPFRLPARLVIRVQSDLIIPEPSTGLLAAPGLLGLSTIIWIRNRKKDDARNLGIRLH